MRKGQKKRVWIAEQKLEIIQKHLEDHISLRTLEKEYKAEHKKHPSHGYHMLVKAVFEASGWVFSHNLAHKCCKQVGIRSRARKYTYKKAGEEHIEFPNEVNGNWNAVRPIEIVVSDMTIFKNNGRNWE